MIVLILSPHFPPSYYLFSVHLNRLGAKVLAIAEEPYFQMHEELRNSFAEYWKVNCMEDYAEVEYAVKTLQERHGKIDRIESHNEHWLLLEAHLRDRFDIYGLKTKDMDRIKKKSVMKEVFKSCGIPVASGKILDNIQDAKEFVKKVNYPVVVKPDIGVGAEDTSKVHNEHELERFFANRNREKNYFFEEFVDGTIETFDGLTDKNGEIVFYTSHQYSGVMETVAADSDIYYYSIRDIPADLVDFGFKSIKAFGVKEKFFHLEFFRRKKDSVLVGLELNARPPGGLTMDMFNYANDFDLYLEWANILVKQQFEAKYSRPYFVCYCSRKDRYNYLHSHDEVQENLGPALCLTGTMPQLFHKVMGSRFYVFRTVTREDMHQHIAYIQKKCQ